MGVIVSRFNGEVTTRLLDGALRAFGETGVEDGDVTVVWVPGAFEIPGAALALAKSGSVDAIACLGAVIRGETEHFTFVASAAQQGVLEAGLSTGLPVTFGVLTTDTLEQAIERSGGVWGNKGSEAARDAVEMANLYRSI